MRNVSPFLIMAVVAAVIGAIMVARQLHEKKRTASLQALATALGLPFFRQGDPGLVQTLSQFHLFSKGRRKQIWNMLHGETDEVDLAIFDYRYTVGSGKHQRTWDQTVVYFDSPLLALPGFALRPENLFHKLGKVVGLQDINFESHPRFSSMFLVQSDSAEQIGEVFRSEVLDWFERNAGVSCEGKGTRLFLYRAGRRIPHTEIRKLMETGFALYGLLKTSK